MCAFIHTLPYVLNMELYWGKTVRVPNIHTEH